MPWLSFSRRALAVLPGVALLVAGCATYHGPSGKDRDAATLEAITPAWVTSVDGKTVAPWFGSGNQRVRLGPGAHRIEVRYSAIAERTAMDRHGRRHPVRVFVEGRGTQMVSLTAADGHAYYLHDGQIGGTWKPFIDESAEPVFVDFKP